jgi:hypothetical protein
MVTAVVTVLAAVQARVFASAVCCALMVGTGELGVTGLRIDQAPSARATKAMARARAATRFGLGGPSVRDLLEAATTSGGALVVT